MSTAAVFTLNNIEVQGLAPRQAEALAHIALGRSAKEAARLMHISHRTVEMSLAMCMQRLDARNRAHLITQAMAAGILAVREGAATAVLLLVLSMSSVPATRNHDPSDWARLQARPARVRTTRRDEITGLLPELV